DVSRRWTLEASGDYAWNHLQIGQHTLANLALTRDTYVTAFNNIIVAGAGSGGSDGIIVARTQEGGQFLGTFGVNYNLTTRGRLIPYLSFGGGLIANTAGSPYAAILAHYQVVGFTSNNVVVAIRGQADQFHGRGRYDMCMK